MRNNKVRSLFALMTASIGGGVYWVLTGLAWMSGQLVFWHPGFAAFVGCAWLVVNFGVALEGADNTCARCKALEREVAEVRAAIATLALPPTTSPKDRP